MHKRMKRVIFVASSSLLLAIGQSVIAQSAPEYASQGWTEIDRNFWYTTTQGSRLIPWSWMQALERADNEQLFLTDENIGRFRYLTYTTPTAPRLPVGFALDHQDDSRLGRTQLRWLPGQGADEPWMGFTCSACHTGEIARGGRRLRIDGAPGIPDYQGFIDALQESLRVTRRERDKWNRFARRVLGNAAADPADIARLAGAMDELIRLQDDLAGMNAIPFRYGYARVDAFGHIFNRTALFAGGTQSRVNPSSAPVSYPFLWNVPQHDLVQWNGSVRNVRIPLGRDSVDIGAIGRNAGEVIGVFGDVVTVPPLPSRLIPPRVGGLPRGFVSSINFDNLIGLERMLDRLLPPAWPEDLLGEIRDDPADNQVERGRVLFQDRCVDCHALLRDRADLTTPIIADMSYLRPNAWARRDETPNIPPNTDPVMACNAYGYTFNSGRLAGYRTGLTSTVPGNAPAISLTGVTVINSIVEQVRELGGTALAILGGFYGGEPNRPIGLTKSERRRTMPSPGASYPDLPSDLRTCVETPWSGDRDALLGYKARPLNGIWATAPYLHNGSVPNLYELLLTPQERMSSFYLGSREFDPVNVGFVTERSDENRFEFRARDERGNIIWGNYNGGHDYGNASLTREQRYDLIEYMKQL